MCCGGNWANVITVYHPSLSLSLSWRSIQRDYVCTQMQRVSVMRSGRAGGLGGSQDSWSSLCFRSIKSKCRHLIRPLSIWAVFLRQPPQHTLCLSHILPLRATPLLTPPHVSLSLLSSSHLLVNSLTLDHLLLSEFALHTVALHTKVQTRWR